MDDCRGHTSKVGVAATIGMKTGKVLDTQAKSKVCKSCEYWQKQDSKSDRYISWFSHHQTVCTLTHDGSPGSIDASAVCDIYKRSVDQYCLGYTDFVGDGDTNTFKKVVSSNAYDGKPIAKLECVGHVQKRVGTRLRNLKVSEGCFR